MLVSALALLSTPGALLLAPRDRVLAAAWLVGAAVVYLLTGPGAARRTLTYSLPYAGAQVVAAVALLLRRAPDADAEPSARPSVPVRALALGAVATVVALYHGILGLWLVMTFGQEGGWARGWWMADAASLLSTPPAVALAAQLVGDFVASKIARFKRPHAVAFTEALPRTADGAVDRDAVKAAWGDTP